MNGKPMSEVRRTEILAFLATQTDHRECKASCITGMLQEAMDEVARFCEIKTRLNSRKQHRKTKKTAEEAALYKIREARDRGHGRSQRSS